MINDFQRKYIIEILSDPNINFNELSKRTGITKVSLYNIKNGKQIPTEKTYNQIIKGTEEYIMNIFDDVFKEKTEQIKELLRKTNSNYSVVISKDNVAVFDNFKIIY